MKLKCNWFFLLIAVPIFMVEACKKSEKPPAVEPPPIEIPGKGNENCISCKKVNVFWLFFKRYINFLIINLGDQ